MQLLQPYTAADPVPAAVNKTFFTRWHKKLQRLDHDMIEQLNVTGEARSKCTKATIVMGHHGGLRNNFEPAAAAIQADLEAGYIEPGRQHPRVVPFIAVARNCVKRKVWRLKDGELRRVIKWRVSTDDTIAVDEDEVSRNAGIDPEEWGRAGLPSALTLPEAVAIVKAMADEMGIEASSAALERIALWALDLCHAYRVLAVQRAEWGQQCYIWFDGIRLDLKCLFGTAHMVEFFQRVTSFVLAVGQHRIAEYDAQHPYSHARQAWLEWRSEALGSSQRCDASYIYLDDALGLTVLGRDQGAT